MYELKEVFINSRYIDNSTLIDVINRIGDWIEIEGNSVEDKYVQNQIEFILKVSEQNKKTSIYPTIEERIIY